METRLVVVSFVLIIVLLGSIFATSEFLYGRQQLPEFFVGVELAYANATFADVKTLVDKVKNYTNLFVIGSPEISKNQTLLNLTCNYISEAGLSFVILFTDTFQYAIGSSPREWISQAKETYGDKFRAVYRFDEPGGRVLDNGTDSFINRTMIGETPRYSLAAETYVEFLYAHLAYYLVPSPSVLSADYGLYWFDYGGGYDVVLAEFGANQSREMNVALCRGAAGAYGKDWGSIITWTYDRYPWIESNDTLYQDLVLSYRSGARYAVVFDYPKNGTYGILTEDHLDAMRKFWNYVQSNPQDYGVDSGEVAYVLPSDYGYGFRSATDHVWVWGPDELSKKAWDDVNLLLSHYGSRLDIVYDDAGTWAGIQSRYSRLFFWNATVSVG